MLRHLCLHMPGLILCGLALACTAPGGAAGDPPEQQTEPEQRPTNEQAIGSPGDRHPAVLGQAYLQGVDGRLQARRIEAILAEPDAALVVLRSRERGVDRVRVHRVPHGATPGASLEAIAEEVFPVAGAGEPPPAVVPLPGRGLALVHRPAGGHGAPPELWWLPLGGDRLVGPQPLPLAEGRQAGAIAPGSILAPLQPSHLLHCDAPDPSHPSSLRCGALRLPDLIPDPPVAPLEATTGPIAALHASGHSEHGVFLTWTAEADGVQTVHGMLVHRSEDPTPRLVPGPTSELAGEPVGVAGAGGPWIGGHPVASVGPSRVAVVLPRTAGAPPRAAQLDRVGDAIGARRQIPAWASRSERVLLFPHRDDHVMLYDAVGRDGERTLVVFTEEGVASMDYWTPLDRPERAADARLGSAGDGLLAVVHDPEEQPGLVSVLTADTMFERAAVDPEVVAEREERRRLHEEEKARFAEPSSQSTRSSDAD